MFRNSRDQQYHSTKQKQVAAGKEANTVSHTSSKEEIKKKKMVKKRSKKVEKEEGNLRLTQYDLHL